MGYTEQDWKAINTIRTLAVSPTPSSPRRVFVTPPPLPRLGRPPLNAHAHAHAHDATVTAWTTLFDANWGLGG